MTRAVEWGGLHNARDLGGLPVGESYTQFSRYFRTPRLDDLEPVGWTEMTASGVRTIVDLRNDDEVAPLVVPNSIRRHRHPIEDQTDSDFMRTWGHGLNSPSYYAATLRLWPERIADVFRTFATAPQGGIVVHCAAGRDRTGMITAMLLQLVGVDEQAIVDDYTLSVVEMDAHAARNPHFDERAKPDDELADWISDVQNRLRDFLAAVSTDKFLTDNSVSKEEINVVRSRLVS